MVEPVQIGDKEYPVSDLCIVSTAKNRHGSTKNTALNFKGSCMHFTDHNQSNFIPIITGNYQKPYSDKDDDAPF